MEEACPKSRQYPATNPSPNLFFAHGAPAHHHQHSHRPTKNESKTKGCPTSHIPNSKKYPSPRNLCLSPPTPDACLSKSCNY